MKTFIYALTRTPISEKEAESLLTEMENWIDFKINTQETKIMKEDIYPIHRETDGIRSEIRILAETMQNGFTLMKERFEKMDQKMDFIRENLEQQIQASRVNLEQQIQSSRENLEQQIKSEKEINQQRFLAMENHFKFHEKLLYTIIGLMVTLSIAVVVKILMV
ncbi:MAG: hypothetical protein H7A24_06165 [Leptospiraceae bacterium]|nr:hypothetical protein [Leptospiraceae bacterium]MCP5511445.1 hypothetical protein [Leptospiraceae bacterium]